VEELKDLIEAVAKLVAALGPYGTVLVLVVLIAYHQLREWQKDRRERTIADEKEAQIQRLADDNRWMRQVLMKKAMGLTDEEIKQLVGDGKPKPLLSGGKGEESK
jgi:uncharacterized membrane protein YhiD involved in acid resistance